ncbi:MAG: TldD/PmbA family protein [Clostridia bacterium]
MEIAQFLKRLFEDAQAAGFEDAEAFYVQGESFEASVHEGEIHTYDVSTDIGLGFRGAFLGKMGYAATQVLDESALKQLIEGAKTNARLIESSDPICLFAGSERYPQVSSAGKALSGVSAARKLEVALALEKAALKVDARVSKLSDCGIFATTGLQRIANTKGLDVCFEDGGAGLYVSPIARAGEQVNSAMKFVYADNVDHFDVDALAREAVSEAVDGLGAEPVASGDYPIAFRNDAAAALLQTFLNVFSGDAAQKGLSLLKDREGEQIASACVTLMDDPLLPSGRSSVPFDAEGVATFEKAVVTDGKLLTLLHNLNTAAKKGVQTTGNAARGSYAAKVSVAPTNFYLKPGACDLDGLLSQMGEGLLITDVQGLHAGANAITGDFSLGAKGYLVAGGKPDRAVAGITVAGNFFDWLKAIEAVGSDLWFGLPGASTVGSPSVLAGKMKVAGALTR